ncbi:hypothetical protein GE09DRAFT_967448 [Coniochaeta sp. 2T2.1]|nr:hypothetical protein GE09DRAFT_967448 [Coniochaeta sp. 2T2.1]
MLDANQLQRLSLTLGRSAVAPGLDVTTEVPPDGTPIPPGYHLVYFTPADLESSLGLDGTDQTYNAPAPFSRRMWAGGQMSWEKDSPVRVGDVVEEHTTLRGATAKRSRSGGEMVLVDVRKEFWTKRGLSLTDQRSWIFRPPPEQAPTCLPNHLHQPTERHIYERSTSQDMQTDTSCKWSPVALFRFSALTFNAHMIHYNETWTREVEGHQDVVVHGPLNLINMLDYWRDHHFRTGDGPQTISYRAMSPIFAGESYAIKTVPRRSNQSDSVELVISKGDVVCMTGSITSSV